MKASWSAALMGLAFLVLTVAPVASDEPWAHDWWPSKWGADDERGSFNTLTPAKVLSSLRVAQSGKVYRLGRPYEMSMPKFGART